MKISHKLFLAVILFVSAAVVALQVPVFLRVYNENYDAESVADLRVIESAITDYAMSNDKLPANIDQVELTDALSHNKSGYTYTPESDIAYKLCASFKAEAGATNSYGNTTMNDYNSSTIASSIDLGKHPKGYHCFSITSNYLKRQKANSTVKPSTSVGPGTPCRQTAVGAYPSWDCTDIGN
jgi:hypothetical protein